MVPRVSVKHFCGKQVNNSNVKECSRALHAFQEEREHVDANPPRPQDSYHPQGHRSEGRGDPRTNQHARLEESNSALTFDSRFSVSSKINRTPRMIDSMKRLQKALIAGLTTASLLVLVSFSTLVVADQNGGSNSNHFTARLDGFQQVPTLFSAGSGEFTATLSADATTLSYTLTYTGLTAASAGHIHLGERGTNGGVSAFLCGGGGKPACPASSGTVSGTITAADIIGPASQGLAAGQFANFLTGLRAGATYVNVHTAAFPGGEIRGQIVTGESD